VKKDSLIFETFSIAFGYPRYIVVKESSEIRGILVLTVRLVNPEPCEIPTGVAYLADACFSVSCPTRS